MNSNICIFLLLHYCKTIIFKNLDITRLLLYFDKRPQPSFGAIIRPNYNFPHEHDKLIFLTAYIYIPRVY